MSIPFPTPIDPVIPREPTQKFDRSAYTLHADFFVERLPDGTDAINTRVQITCCPYRKLADGTNELSPSDAIYIDISDANARALIDPVFASRFASVLTAVSSEVAEYVAAQQLP